MSDNTEAKHLRGIINSWQIWCERHIALGLIDIENTPICFDRTKNTLKEMISKTDALNNSLETTCFHCSQPLTAKRVTDNHIRWFCNEKCMTDYDKAEGQALRTKEHD